jgi:tetratricopeptide (TPR) repeat protein
MIASTLVIAQPENAAIAKGNKLYKDGKFEEAIAAYQQALQQNPENVTAKYNLAAARFRNSKFEEAQKEYEGVLEKTSDSKLKEKATYNNGVALIKQSKLEESIEAFKKALLLNPQDADTRFNLQKALEEEHKKNKAKEQPQQQKKQEKKKEPQKQPPASRKQIEQWMQSLRQKEQEVQQKMQQNKSRSVNKPEKDW